LLGVVFIRDPVTPCAAGSTNEKLFTHKVHAVAQGSIGFGKSALSRRLGRDEHSPAVAEKARFPEISAHFL
jgi:hypothetical protein